MSDHLGNNVNEEIRVPVRDFIDRVEIGAVKDGSQKPEPWENSVPVAAHLRNYKEWAVAHSDGKIGGDTFTSEGKALKELQVHRRHLRGLGIPEEHWPVLLERDVETVASSWRFRSE